MRAITGYLKRTPNGKTHRWVEKMNELGQMRTWCGLEAPRAGIYVPKYKSAPTCAKCRVAGDVHEEGQVK